MTPLFELFARPQRGAGLSAAEWDDVLGLAFASELVGRLYHRLDDAGCGADVPPMAWRMLVASSHQPRFVQTRVLWELRHLRRALRGVCEPVVLKGGAYAAADLPFARGRMLADLDVLIPREMLSVVETALEAAGYVVKELDDYDDRYYREWMHELPPMVHPNRGVEVDIHHTLLPLIGRVHPDARALLEAALPSTARGCHVLCPADMVLNTVAHLYQGEIVGAHKDVIDLLLMLEHFGSQPQFSVQLLDRAAVHGMQAPLAFAIRLLRRLFNSYPQEALVDQLCDQLTAGILDSLSLPVSSRALRTAPGPGRPDWLTRQFLLARSHWIRMPPGLLFRHLTRKGLKRMAGPRDAMA